MQYNLTAFLPAMKDIKGIGKQRLIVRVATSILDITD